MHQQKTVGKAVHLMMIPGRGLLVGAEITDKECLEKIQNGSYLGFSIGGIVHNKQKRFFGGRMVSVIDEMTIAEISIVDQPANGKTGLMISPQKKEDGKLFEKWFGKSTEKMDEKVENAENTETMEELVATLLEKVDLHEKQIQGILDILDVFDKNLGKSNERISGIEGRFTAKKSVSGQSGTPKKRHWESVLSLIS